MSNGPPRGTMLRVGNAWHSRSFGEKPKDQRASALWEQAVGGLQRLDSLNQNIRAGRPIPEISARQSAIKKESARFGNLQSAHDRLVKQIAEEKRALTMKVTDRSNESYTGALLRGEARAMLRTMDQREKMRAVENSPGMAAALLETDTRGNTFPELSGVNREFYQMQLARETARMFPHETAALSDAEDGLRQLETAFSTAKEVIDAELVASGASDSVRSEESPPAWFAPAAE